MSLTPLLKQIHYGKTLLNDPDLALKFYITAAKYVSRRLRGSLDDLTITKGLCRHF